MAESTVPASDLTPERPTVRSLPFYVWPLALFFAFAFMLPLCNLLLMDTPRSEAFELFNGKRIDAFAAKVAAGADGIVLMGDSRLRYALVGDDDLAARLSAGRATPVAVLRVARNGGAWQHFAGLADRIIAARPKLIVLQNALFAKEFLVLSRIRRARDYLVWRLVGQGPWNPGKRDQADMQYEADCDALTDIDAPEYRNRLVHWVKFDPKGPNARGINAFIAAAEAAGIAVAALGLPTTPEAVAESLSYRRPPDRRTIDLGTTLPDKMFCDVVHMNDVGRPVFTAALVERLRTRLEMK